MSFRVSSGFQYAGMEYGYECWCGDTLAPARRAEGDVRCDHACPGGGDGKCGGYLHASVYHTGVGGMSRVKKMRHIFMPFELHFSFYANI